MTTTSVTEFGKQHWPSTGRIWVRITPDGSRALGWRDKPYTGTAAKALHAEAKSSAAAFEAMFIGDVCTVPVGYHPKHGTKTETYLRVR